MEYRELGEFLTPERRTRIDKVLNERTRTLGMLVEGITDPHNVAACIRSVEGFGLQELHVITGEQKFQPNRKVTQGSAKWVDIIEHCSPRDAVSNLRDRGYKIYCGTLTADARPIGELDFSEKTILALGNEHAGISRELQELSDGSFFIPMRGFTQSFNISVAAAVSVFHGVSERVRRFGKNGDLEAEDMERLRQRWYGLSVPRADMVNEELERRRTAMVGEED